MAAFGKLGYLLTIVCLSLIFSLAQTSTYARRGNATRSACYIPRDKQFARSLYFRVSGLRLGRIQAGNRISNNNRIAAVCRSDVQVDAIMGRTIHRCLYGKWKPPLPTCIQKKRCGAVPVVQNTTASELYNEHSSFPDGYDVTYTCDEGFLQFGSNAITCKGGEWTELPLICIGASDVAKCTEKKVTHADVSEISVTQYKVTCHYGYKLGGDQDVFQCSAGEWLENEPNCQPVECPRFFRVRYDVLIGGQYGAWARNRNRRSLVHGSVIKLRCRAGELPVRGNQRIECDNGVWKPNRPACRRYCEIRDEYRTNSRYMSGNTLICPGDTTPHGNTIVQKCLSEGNAERRRCIHGRWRPELKQCETPDPSFVPPIECKAVRKGVQENVQGCSLIDGNNFEFSTFDGAFTYDSSDVINHGAAILQTCKVKDEEALEQDHVIKCENGTWSPGMVACPGVACGININQSYVFDGLLTSPGYGKDFPQYAICMCTFDLKSSNDKVKVTFEKFNFSGQMPNCTRGYVSFKHPGGKRTKYCGEELPPEVEMEGPQVLMEFTTLGAEVANFKADFHFVEAPVICPNPDEEVFEVSDPMEVYAAGESVELTGCRDENTYLSGPNIWFCQESGTWDAITTCVEYENCSLPEKKGISYRINDNEFVSGYAEHGESVVVSAKCDDVNGDDTGNVIDIKNSQMLDCDNGTLSDDILTCPEKAEPVDEDFHCVKPPIPDGVQFSPIKKSYKKGETVTIDGCDNPMTVPVGVANMACQEGGDWAGSVRCWAFCKNGQKVFQETKYSYFRRSGNVKYHQYPTKLDSSFECANECEYYNEFLCRSVEYRNDTSTCILTDAVPNPEDFFTIEAVSSVITEIVCYDDCTIPEDTQNDVTFTNTEGHAYAIRQKVPSGTVVKVTCQNNPKSRDMTCLGGEWDIMDFC